MVIITLIMIPVWVKRWKKRDAVRSLRTTRKARASYAGEFNHCPTVLELFCNIAQYLKQRFFSLQGPILINMALLQRICSIFIKTFCEISCQQAPIGVIRRTENWRDLVPQTALASPYFNIWNKVFPQVSRPYCQLSK